MKVTCNFGALLELVSCRGVEEAMTIQHHHSGLWSILPAGG